MDTCFKKFDEIIIEFGLEKIKTVGDAYLAVGGLPDNNKATALDVVTAAFKMVEFTSQRVNDRKNKTNLVLKFVLVSIPVPSYQEL